MQHGRESRPSHVATYGLGFDSPTARGRAPLAPAQPPARRAAQGASSPPSARAALLGAGFPVRGCATLPAATAQPGATHTARGRRSNSPATRGRHGGDRDLSL